ncbi:YraN family protein [Desulfobacula sp.]|uniref:YraN family protein n=1 Tax=Desulfobacula sp. TaxID=2593537 RepID=UPI0026275E83|nr:YraN family protein [Desulfobacula sp.]
MTDDGKTLGHAGETAAAAFLRSQGFAILETNYRTKTSEIDIIARDKEYLCFVEVKTRRSLKKGLPREAVTRSKQKKIILGALFYLKHTHQMDIRVRFDVVEVYENKDGFSFYLMKNAFQGHQNG